MKLFDQLNIGSQYKGLALRKFFPGVNSTFLVNFKTESLQKIIEFIEQNSFYNYIFVFTVTDTFLKGKSLKSSYAVNLAKSSKIIVAFKARKNYNNNELNIDQDETNFERMNVEIPGFYRQGSYMSGEEQKRDWKLVHKKPGFRLKPETEKHFGDILTGLNFNESCQSILKEHSDYDYLIVGELTQGEKKFIQLATNEMVDAIYNLNKQRSVMGYDGILKKMSILFAKATGYTLPDAFMRKIFYVYPNTSYFSGQNQTKYVRQHYIDKYQLNLILPQTGGFWVFSVVNAVILKLIDHHKRKEIHDIILPFISRYVMSGLHELADIVETDALFSKDEIKALKNYFVRRKLKPQTDKHFGDILTSL
jgi:hypothetical protein